MRTLIFAVLLILVSHYQLLAQQNCSSYSYKQQELLNDPSLKNEVNTIENFVHQKIASSAAGIAGKEAQHSDYGVGAFGGGDSLGHDRGKEDATVEKSVVAALQGGERR